MGDVSYQLLTSVPGPIHSQNTTHREYYYLGSLQLWSLSVVTRRTEFSTAAAAAAAGTQKIKNYILYSFFL